MIAFKFVDFGVIIIIIANSAFWFVYIARHIKIVVCGSITMQPEHTLKPPKTLSEQNLRTCGV